MPRKPKRINRKYTAKKFLVGAVILPEDGDCETDVVAGEPFPFPDVASGTTDEGEGGSVEFLFTGNVFDPFSVFPSS